MRGGDNPGVRDHRDRGFVVGEHHGAVPRLVEGGRRRRSYLRPR